MLQGKGLFDDEDRDRPLRNKISLYTHPREPGRKDEE